MRPPFPLRLLKWFCKPDYHLDVEGDLIEMHDKRVQQIGRRRANLLLWRDVIFLFRPGIIRSVLEERPHNIVSVAHHNVLISFRNFWKRKTPFFINLGSLSAGLTCVLLIYTWIANEISVDKFHEKDKRIYRIRANYTSPTGINTIDTTPSPLAEALASEMPEVEYAVSMSPFFDWFKGPGIISHENKQVTAEGFFASKDFFNVFSFRMLYGDSHGLTISSSLAKKLFRHEADAIGKLVDWSHTMRLQGPFQIAGVFNDLPENSTLKFDIIFPYERLAEGDIASKEWNSTYSHTVLLLREGTDIEVFNKKIAGFVVAKEPKNPGQLFVSLFSNKYLYDEGRIGYVRLFSLVAIFTLAIACINFVNLSTAQASRKMKEVGVKKTLGVSRLTLITQFVTESLIMALLSLIVAVLLAALLLPSFSQLTGKHLTMHLDPKFVAFVFIVGILAGCYPALFLSAFKPAEVIKGKLATSTFGEVFIRKGLVILQFTISIVFIAAFMIVNRQIKFVQTRSLGYSKDNVVSFSWRGQFDPAKYEVFVQEVKSIPGVINASNMNGSILNRDNGMHTGFSWEGQTGDAKSIGFPSPTISHDLIETLGIELKEGRTFLKDVTGEDGKMIVNEEAVRMMGFTDAIGKVVFYGTEPKEIVGVLKDFQYGSLHARIRPVFFMYAPFRRDIVVRLQPGFETYTIEQLQAVFQKHNPGYPFEFTFLDDDYAKLYDSEARVSTLSTWFAILATMISCLGLFGLAVFSSERRMKEIGIRKVLGATSSSIVQLLASDIVRPVLVAILLATPLSYFIAKGWLDAFAYRIELSGWFFVAAGVTALVVTCITVGLQTLKVAKANPVDSLKME